jgi:hypothetical protein
LMFEEADSCL